MLSVAIFWALMVLGVPLILGAIVPIVCLGLLEAVMGPRAKRVPTFVLDVVAGASAMWITVGLAALLGVTFWWLIPTALAALGSIYLWRRRDAAGIAAQTAGLIIGLWIAA